MPNPKNFRPCTSSLADRLRGAVATYLFARLFADELVYCHLERIYWEGVTHPDGGDYEEEAEIHAAEGAQTALRRIADLAGGRRHATPDHASANSMVLERLREELNLSESLT